MECNNIKEQLSAHIDNQLSADDRSRVDEHLKGCADCTLYMDDLKRTIAYSKGLEQVEPPAWLTQKVMSRIREAEEQKKGFLWKLFHPVSIKGPVQVIATLAVAVTAFYVYKTVEPELKYAEAPSEKTGFSATDEPKFFSGKDAVLEEAPAAPSTAGRQRADKEADDTAGRMMKRNEFAPAPELDRIESSVGAGEESETLRKKSRLSADEVERSFEAIEGVTETREQYPAKTEKFKALDMDVKEEVRGIAPELKGMIEEKWETEPLIIYVDDIKASRKQIRTSIEKLGGKIIRTETVADREIITAELASEKIDELNKDLAKIGELKETDALYVPGFYDERAGGTVEIIIEINLIGSDLRN